MSKKGLAIALVAGFGIAMALAHPSQAQTPSSADLLRDPQSQDSLNNLFNNRGDNATTGLLDLIQRVSQGSVDPETFRQQQRESLDAATAAYLAKRRALQTQPQTAPTQVAPLR